ncbi:MAG: hypothetical protein ACD_75C00934G0001 [uncultured bacterium]|nr:MAG: hypothetical protein ACD_75C00934G0001 [uncultured bacterium]HBG18983.1 hypothetical protein [Desulfobulbaceae bacterium]
MFSTALAIFSLLISASAWATVSRHLGIVGRTFPIVEPDLLAELRESSSQFEQSREELLAQIKNYQPANLHPLPRATADRTFLVDMRYILDRDLTDAHGNIIYPKGYSFNPLEYIVLAGGLIVIDGSDPSQVSWFMRSPYSQNQQTKLLLVGGQAADLIEKVQRPAFYLTSDMAERLRLAAAPALIMRKGDKMQVQEFYVPPAEPGSSNEN